METLKGKGMNTSVPSISIRFNANAEEIEELYQSEDETVDKFSGDKTKTVGVNDPDTSPLRYLPRLGKRSTSIDTSLTAQDSSPPTDRWKFFSEIKGKITNRVEEIKHRNQETESAAKKTKNAKDKDNSSLSESDDMSESSISKTCGVSTTEGVEMSSDDETPSMEEDKNVPKFKEPPPPNTKQHRYRVIRKRKPFREGKIAIEKLADLYEITTGTKPNISLHNSTSKETVEVESGVEALEDVNPQQSDNFSKSSLTCDSETEMISGLVSNIENVQLDEDNVISVTPISGDALQSSQINAPRTYLAPEGFVDVRYSPQMSFFDKIIWFRYLLAVIAIIIIQLCTSIPTYVTSFVLGVIFTLFLNYFFGFYTSKNTVKFANFDLSGKPVIEIPAVKEYRALVKIEGWMNEYPEVYNPQTYHVSCTQPVYIKLQGNLLRVSNTKNKIPKRAMWNEPEYKNIVFTNHRVYNLLGADISLAPNQLNRRRRWSKKYPICITFNPELDNPDNIDFDSISLPRSKKDVDASDPAQKKQKDVAKKRSDMETQIFSKLTEEEILNEDEKCLDLADFKTADNEDDEDSKDDDEMDEDSLCEWGAFLSQDSPCGTQIYLFGRTDREKEEWFRYFRSACRKLSDGGKDIDNNDPCAQIFDSFNETVQYQQDFNKFMSRFDKLTKKIKVVRNNTRSSSSLLWINAIVSRILFDFTHDDTFTSKVQERIQKKLDTIKLPQFVEQLSVSELNLGNSPPLIHSVQDPTVDNRGLWVDMNVHYEGNVCLKLQTKLNLMRLKHNNSLGASITEVPVLEKWQYSDVEDTAESSSDDARYTLPASGKTPEINSNPSNSRKFMKMVDKITESKIFQAATENRYIKRAMEGVSNTDLYLKVELKGLTGTLVLNIPPPPSDRMWIGFRPLPKLILSAQPIVGDKSIPFIRHLSNWIEKKLTLEFQKVLVLPNMEDIVIPVMISKLPT